jgi:hypothetical protein
MSPDSWGLERTKTPVERLFPREGPGALGEVNASFNFLSARKQVRRRPKLKLRCSSAHGLLELSTFALPRHWGLVSLFK